MIVCSCTGISDRDIETVLIEILNQPEAPIPTPGLVYRRLSQRMNCCGCAPLAVATIYEKVELLEKRGEISPYACATARKKLLQFSAWRKLLRSRAVAVPPLAIVLEETVEVDVLEVA